MLHGRRVHSHHTHQPPRPSSAFGTLRCTSAPQVAARRGGARLASAPPSSTLPIQRPLNDGATEGGGGLYLQPSRAAEEEPSTSQPASRQDDDIESVYFTEAQIAERVSELGGRLALDYRDKAPLVIGVLKGSFIFMADMVRAMQPCPRGLTTFFVRASSYGSSTVSSGSVTVCDVSLEIARGRHVILVEDIIDTGRTISALKLQLLDPCGAASVRIVTLLDKKARRKVPFEPDYCCLQCPDLFVVGYGLDFDEEYRALPYIGVLKPECYMHKQ